jgi:hypothetical protein
VDTFGFWIQTSHNAVSRGVVPGRSNLKDGYDTGLVVRDPDSEADSGALKPAVAHEAGKRLSNPLRDSLSVDFVRIIMREHHLVIGITGGVRSKFRLSARTLLDRDLEP